MTVTDLVKDWSDCCCPAMRGRTIDCLVVSVRCNLSAYSWRTTAFDARAESLAGVVLDQDWRRTNAASVLAFCWAAMVMRIRWLLGDVDGDRVDAERTIDRTWTQMTVQEVWDQQSLAAGAVSAELSPATGACKVPRPIRRSSPLQRPEPRACAAQPLAGPSCVVPACLSWELAPRLLLAAPAAAILDMVQLLAARCNVERHHPRGESPAECGCVGVNRASLDWGAPLNFNFTTSPYCYSSRVDTAVSHSVSQSASQPASHTRGGHRLSCSLPKPDAEAYLGPQRSPQHPAHSDRPHNGPLSTVSAGLPGDSSTVAQPATTSLLPELAADQLIAAARSAASHLQKCRSTIPVSSPGIPAHLRAPRLTFAQLHPLRRRRTTRRRQCRRQHTRLPLATSEEGPCRPQRTRHPSIPLRPTAPLPPSSSRGVIPRLPLPPEPRLPSLAVPCPIHPLPSSSHRIHLNSSSSSSKQSQT